MGVCTENEQAFYGCKKRRVSMKRLIPVIIAMILILSAAPVAFAAEPQQPVMNGEMPDCYQYTGEEITLWCYAEVADGGTLTYQWYVSDTPEMPNIRAIDGAVNSTYSFSREQPYVAYYCCGVWNEVGGVKSQPTYTRLIRAEFFVPGPLSPTINSQMPDCYMPIGKDITVWCDAVSPDGGILEYQWFVSENPSYENMYPVTAGAESTLTLDSNKPKVEYYCCAVKNTFDSLESAPVYTRLIRVEFYDPDPAETVIGIAVSNMPDKLKYKVGEDLDLKGLKVKVSTNKGAKELEDNSKLEVTGYDKSKAGMQSVFISYEGKITSFMVEVAEESAQPPKNDTQNQVPVNTVPNGGSTQNNTENAQNSASNNNSAPAQPAQSGSFTVNTLTVILIALVGVLVGVILVLLLTKKKK